MHETDELYLDKNRASTRMAKVEYTRTRVGAFCKKSKTLHFAMKGHDVRKSMGIGLFVKTRGRGAFIRRFQSLEGNWKRWTLQKSVSMLNRKEDKKI